MRKSRGFTLIELLVVIAIIALLMSILMPALARVKNQAKTVGCRANLRQWNLFFSMYTEDNSGQFEAGTGNGHMNHWMNTLRPLYKNDHKITCCPTAQKPLVDRNGVSGGQWNVSSAWGVFTGEGYGPDGDWGSYGINGWVENPPADTGDGVRRVRHQEQLEDAQRENGGLCAAVHGRPAVQRVPAAHG